MMDFQLEGKVVVITGAGAGIGLEAAKAFLSEGAIVVGGDLNPDALSELADKERVLPIKVDMSSAEGANTLINAAITRFGRVDVLFNNAGVASPRRGFLAVSDEQWAKTLALNLLGYVRASRAVLPHMLKQGKGVLLHTASEAARMPNPRLPDYSVSKAAIVMLSKALAGEFTSQGIRSNVISPGFIRTAIYDKPGGLADSLAAEFNLDREEALEHYVKLNDIPVGRLGRPDEVASLAVYLASDRAGFVSGADFTVDGGVTPVV
jgi:NAD(P)-dependent dehydrogenase (short-subunit alcohol dehydrogenase family)